MSDNYKEFVDNIRELLTAIKDDDTYLVFSDGSMQFEVGSSMSPTG